MRWRGASRRSARLGRGLCSKAPRRGPKRPSERERGGVPRAEDDGAIIGYAYASAHHERAAYRWSVSTAIYVSRDHHRRGAGRALYTTLFALLRALGYRQATAGITLPNPASVGLHEAFGFAPVGVYRQIGYKMGEWHDVGWYQAEIQPAAVAPMEPLSVRELAGTSAWDEAVQRGLELYYGSRASNEKRKTKSE